MVVVRTVHKLRERPKDERVAVAAGTALSVVALLFIGWAAFFLHGAGSGQFVETAVPPPSGQVQQTASASPATPLWQSQATSSNETTIPPRP